MLGQKLSFNNSPRQNSFLKGCTGVLPAIYNQTQLFYQTKPVSVFLPNNRCEVALINNGFNMHVYINVVRCFPSVS